MNCTRNAVQRMAALSLVPMAAMSSIAVAQPLEGSIVQPTLVTTSYRQAFNNIGRIDFMNDQSGLSAPYVSGETDFDTYVSATGHNNSNSTMALVNTNGQNQPAGFVDLGGTITLDLGAEVLIDAVALWAATVGSETITRMAVHADTDADFANGGTTLLETFDVERTLAGRAYRFAPTETRFVHIEVLGHGGGSFLRHGEFAARASGVRCAAEVDGSGQLDIFDVIAFLQLFGNGDLSADVNDDGLVTIFDVIAYLELFNAGCP